MAGQRLRRALTGGALAVALIAGALGSTPALASPRAEPGAAGTAVSRVPLVAQAEPGRNKPPSPQPPAPEKKPPTVVGEPPKDLKPDPVEGDPPVRDSDGTVVPPADRTEHTPRFRDRQTTVDGSGLTPDDPAEEKAESRRRGKSAAGPAVTAQTAGVPETPTGVTGANGRNGTFTVSWTPPANGGSPITGYTVTASPGGATKTVPGSASSAVFTGLTFGSPYTFTVAAANAAGSGPVSAPSAPATPVAPTAPGPVTALSVVPGNAEATANWQLPAADGGADVDWLSIALYRADGTFVQSTGSSPPSTPYKLPKLINGTTYYVTVSVSNDWATGPTVQSAPFTPLAGPRPGPPATAAAQPGNAGATVSWTVPGSDGGSPVTGYRITTYDSNGNAVGNPVNAAADAASATVTGLTNNTSYFFGVSAVNSAGPGPEQTTAYVRPAGPPGTPTAVTAYPGDGQLAVTWKEPADNGARIAGYTLTATGPDGTVLSVQNLTSEPSSTPPPVGVLSGLPPETPVKVTVTAINWAGTGSPSAPVTATLKQNADITPTGGLVQIPPTAGWDNAKDDAHLSGDGRYVFYLSNLDPQFPQLDLKTWAYIRYDTVTGAKVLASVDSSGNLMKLRYASHSMGVGSSYDGSSFLFTATADAGRGAFYLRDFDTGRTVLASPNRTGAEPAGWAAQAKLSADGSTVVFALEGTSDMAQHQTCTGNDLYRYDVATGAVSQVVFNLTTSQLAKAGHPVAGTHVSCWKPWAAPGTLSISSDGSRVAAIGELSYRRDNPNNFLDSTFVMMTNIPTADGSGDAWYSGRSFSTCVVTTCMTLVGGITEQVFMSADGTRAVLSGHQMQSVIDTSWGNSPYDYFRVSLPDGLAQPAPKLDRGPFGYGIEAASADASVVVGIPLGGAGQLVAMNTQTNGFSILSQADGAAGTRGSDIGYDGLSATGDLAAFSTSAPNLLGGVTDSNVVLSRLSKAAFLPIDQLIGCVCGDSLASDRPRPVGAAGDPVNTATGAFSESVTDARLPGTGVTLDFARTYDSAGTTRGPLGIGWQLGYGMSLSAGPGGTVTVTSEAGAKGVFRRMPDGSYRSDPGITSTLTASPTGYTLTTRDHRRHLFSAAGVLTAIQDRSGQGLTLIRTGTRITGLTDAAGRTATLSYDDPSGRLTLLTLADGRTVRYTYDASGRLASVTGLDGGTRRYGYDSGDRLTSVTEPDGSVRVDNTYDPATGRVTRQTIRNGSGTGTSTTSWDAAGQVASYTDANGAVSKDYYAGNVLQKHIDGNGGVTRYRYDSQLNPVTVTDPSGRVTKRTYDAAGRVLTRTSPGPSPVTESWTYDAKGNRTSHTDGAGATTSSTYDAANRLVSVKDPLGRTTSYTYSTAGELLTATTPGGKVSTFTYDTAGNITSAVDQAGGRTTYGYDTAGRRVTATDPLGNVPGADPALHTTRYGYLPNGRLGTLTDPLGNATGYGYDAAGNRVSVTDPLGNTTTATYDPFGRVLTTTDANGRTTTNTYDPVGNLTKTTDPLGNTTGYGYDREGRPTTVVSPRGNAPGARPADFTTTFGYDAVGNRTHVTDPMGNTTTTAYDELDRPVRTTDPLGNTTTREYDGAGRTTVVKDPLGGTVRRAYNAAGEQISGTDADGRTSLYGYDADGNQVSVKSPLGAVTTTTYDGNGRVLGVTDPLGNSTNNSYDAAGQLVKVTAPDGATTTYGYDAAGRLTSSADPGGRSTGRSYNQAGRLTGVTDPLGNTTTSSYDPAGRLVAQTDPLGGRTTYGYDAAGNRTSVTMPRGNVVGARPADFTTGYAYDQDGHPTRVTDPTGAATVTTYDSSGRVIGVTDPIGATAATTYDAAGRITVSTDPTLRASRNQYDAAGRLTASIDPLGNTTSFAYSPGGLRLSTRSPLGATTTWTYDADGRLSTTTDPRGNAPGATPASYTETYGHDAAGRQTTVSDPLGRTTRTDYDAAGRVTAVTDPLGNTSRRAYDVAGRLTGVTDPDQNRTAYDYDPVGNMISRTDPNTHTTAYRYDAAGRPTAVTDPLGRTTAYGYDADGNRTTATDARGITTTTAFDGRGLVTATGYSDGTPAVSYGYDPAGRRTRITDATGTRSLGYDAAGRTVAVGVPGAADKAFRYGYNGAGLLESRTYPDGEKADLGYDAEGRQTSRTVNGARTTYGYDLAGNPTTAVLPNGLTETRGYDAAGQVVGVTTTKGAGTVSSWQYRYDAAGRPVQADSVRGGTTQPPQYYGYDKRGRLTSWCTSAPGTVDCPAGSSQVGYGYDKVGNRSTLTKAGKTTTYTYDAADQLTVAATGLIRQVYTYDAAGNMTGNGSSVNSIGYDATNHPVRSVQGSTSYTFTNDDAGNRVTTTANGATVRTDRWDVNGPLPQLASSTDGAGALIGDYHTDPAGRPESQRTPTGTSYAVHDALGSVTDLTDTNGNGQYRYSYDPYGVPTATQLTADAADSPFGFTGQLNDPSLIGKQNLRARQYDPATGRFLSTDPISLRPTSPYTSAYAYAEDAPTYRTDPSGLTPLPGDPNDVMSGEVVRNDGENHDFAVQMGWRQLSNLYGAGNVYADIAGFYGPVGKMWRIPGAGRQGGPGEPDLAARNRPVGSGLGWWLWEVKPATQAGMAGTNYNRGGADSWSQLNNYAETLTTMGTPARAGDNVVVPQSQINEVNGNLVTIFRSIDWATYGGNYDSPITPDMQGLIFYSAFRPKRDKARSQEMIKELPAINLAAHSYDLSVEDMLAHLGDMKGNHRSRNLVSCLVLTTAIQQGEQLDQFAEQWNGFVKDLIITELGGAFLAGTSGVLIPALRGGRALSILEVPGRSSSVGGLTPLVPRLPATLGRGGFELAA
nr:hypothetical protein KPHV_44960 [Kitasatospora purpeofusca]